MISVLLAIIGYVALGKSEGFSEPQFCRKQGQHA